MSESISEGDLRAIEVNAEKVAKGAPASAQHWGETALRLVEAVREAREWVGRLTAQTRVLTCAFCGEAYPPGTPETNHDRLTAHVAVCPKHPMRAVEVALAVSEARALAMLPVVEAARAQADVCSRTIISGKTWDSWIQATTATEAAVRALDGGK